MTRARVLNFLLLPLVALVLLGATGCGGGDAAETATAPAGGATDPASTVAAEGEASATKGAKTSPTADASAAAAAKRPPGEDGLRVAAQQARLVVQDSEFGRVLFDANGQVVYAFEQDHENQSNCTSAECVKAWPPVLTKDAPSAGTGVDASLLGTITRGDGSTQVTYAGRPLYFYEHEGPGEIRCHNVNLHGGLWWVVTPAGDPAP